MTVPPGGPRQVLFRPGYPLRTQRLLLRPHAYGDVDGLYAYQRLPEVHRYLYSEPRTRAEVEWADELIYAILRREWEARQPPR